MYCEGGESPPYGGAGFVGIWGYTPSLAWGDWNYMQNYATDSAAAATAMSTGYKTYKGSIGMGVGGGPGAREVLDHVSSRAEQLGMATGFVTSVQISHATPVGFWAHNESRSNYDEIALELIGHPHLDVVMGAGHPNYDSDGNWAPGDPGNPGDWKYVGDYATWQSLENGTAGSGRPWTLVETKEDFEALANGDLEARKVFGVAQVAYTLQYNRSGMPDYNDPEPPYADPMVENVPSLETMTRGMLKVLERQNRGIFAVIEGGAIDWAGHGRTLGRLIEEQIDFDNSVDAVIEWVEANSNWDESLVVVTGDHETGFLWGDGVDPADPATWFLPIQDNGPGNMPGFRFYSEPDGPSSSAGHTNQVIPFYAKGYGTDQLVARADEFDPRRGAYLDNVELPQVLFNLLEQPPRNHYAVRYDVPDLQSRAVGASPTSPTTRISFTLSNEAPVSLRVFDVQGRVVATPVDGVMPAGRHTASMNGASLRSGVYFYRVASQGASEQGKFLVLR